LSGVRLGAAFFVLLAAAAGAGIVAADFGAVEADGWCDVGAVGVTVVCGVVEQLWEI